LPNRGRRLIEVVRALDTAGVQATDVHRRDATLDDVFLTVVRNRSHQQPEDVVAS